MTQAFNLSQLANKLNSSGDYSSAVKAPSFQISTYQTLSASGATTQLNFSQYTSIFGGSGGISIAADNGSGGYYIPIQVAYNGKSVGVGGPSGLSPSWAFVAATNNVGGSGIAGLFDASPYAGSTAIGALVNSTGSGFASFFYGTLGGSSNVGGISTNGSSVSYNTTSDYRLKENVQSIVGATDKIKLLRPVTYKWINSNNTGEGFIAHELQEVVPEAVNGEKDASDAEGKPIYQGIDPSKLVAVLTAALQESIARIEKLEQTVVQLNAKISQ